MPQKTINALSLYINSPEDHIQTNQFDSTSADSLPMAANLNFEQDVLKMSSSVEIMLPTMNSLKDAVQLIYNSIIGCQISLAKEFSGSSLIGTPQMNSLQELRCKQSIQDSVQEKSILKLTPPQHGLQFTDRDFSEPISKLYPNQPDKLVLDFLCLYLRLTQYGDHTTKQYST